jgi:DNA/RNA endonuclease G (NUC1)
VTSGWLKARLAEIQPVSISIPVTPSEEGKSRQTHSGTGRVVDLTGREGYKADFLGPVEFEVPLPEINVRLTDQIAPVKGRSDGELKYSHFSIFMRADRRLPFYTACNIDGSHLYNFPRGRDHLSQADYLTDLEFRYGEFKTYQVPICQIEAMTTLFFNLSSFDPLNMTETSLRREICGPSDLIL